MFKSDRNANLFLAVGIWLALLTLVIMPKWSMAETLEIGATKDIWTTSVYSYTGAGGGPGGGRDDMRLRIGGWGDEYRALIKFDLSEITGPIVSAKLVLYHLGSDDTRHRPVSMLMDRVNSDWDWTSEPLDARTLDNDRLWWDDRPSFVPYLNYIPAPGVGVYQEVEVTSLVTGWLAGDYANYGLQLRPTSIYAEFNYYASSDHTNPEWHPILLVEILSVDSDGDGLADDVDNCPDLPNPLAACTSGAECLGPDNSCDVISGYCIAQFDTDGDTQGDVCDSDDDNDGVKDLNDNCPITGNPNQMDSDFDGLGDSCDSAYDVDGPIGHIESNVQTSIRLLVEISPPGANGLITKLNGKGGVLTKVANVVEAYFLGLISRERYLSGLQKAIIKLDAFDSQLDEKIDNSQISSTEAEEVSAASAEIRYAIDSLISN